MTDLGADYIRNRSREVRLLRSQARIHLAQATDLVRLQRMRGNAPGLATARTNLVRCMADYYVADAMCAALGDLR